MEKIAKAITKMGFTIEEFEDNLNNTTYAIFKNGMGIGFIYQNRNFDITIPKKADNELIKSIENLTQYLEFLEINSNLEQIENKDGKIEFIIMKYMSNYLTVALAEDNKIYNSYIVDENGEIRITQYSNEKQAVKRFILMSKALSEDELKVEVTLKSKIIDKGINILNNMKNKGE